MSLAEFQSEFPRLCSSLRQAKKHDRLGHAYLIVGDDDALLERFGRAWARVCACLQAGPDGDACGSCEPCRALGQDTYPELYEVRPTSQSRQIPVADIRALEHQLALAAGAGRCKIGFIVAADCMNFSAQNAFLKTLEEPPPHTLLILCSGQPRRLLPTIRSRCQILSFMRNRKSYDKAAEAGVFPLLARLQPDAGAAVGIAVAHGLVQLFARLRKQAEEQVSSEPADQRWDVVAADDSQLRKRLEEERKARIEAEYRQRRQEICDAIQTWFLQKIILATGVGPELLPHPEFQPYETEQKPGPGPWPWQAAEAAVDASAELLQCLELNVNERLALEAFCLRVTARVRA